MASQSHNGQDVWNLLDRNNGFDDIDIVELDAAARTQQPPPRPAPRSTSAELHDVERELRSFGYLGVEEPPSRRTTNPYPNRPDAPYLPGPRPEAVFPRGYEQDGQINAQRSNRNFLERQEVGRAPSEFGIGPRPPPAGPTRGLPPDPPRGPILGPPSGPPPGPPLQPRPPPVTRTSNPGPSRPNLNGNYGFPPDSNWRDEDGTNHSPAGVAASGQDRKRDRRRTRSPGTPNSRRRQQAQLEQQVKMLANEVERLRREKLETQQKNKEKKRLKAEAMRQKEAELEQLRIQEEETLLEQQQAAEMAQQRAQEEAAAREQLKAAETAQQRTRDEETAKEKATFDFLEHLTQRLAPALGEQIFRTLNVDPENSNQRRKSTRPKKTEHAVDKWALPVRRGPLPPIYEGGRRAGPMMEEYRPVLGWSDPDSWDYTRQILLRRDPYGYEFSNRGSFAVPFEHSLQHYINEVVRQAVEQRIMRPESEPSEEEFYLEEMQAQLGMLPDELREKIIETIRAHCDEQRASSVPNHAPTSELDLRTRQIFEQRVKRNDSAYDSGSVLTSSSRGSRNGTRRRVNPPVPPTAPPMAPAVNHYDHTPLQRMPNHASSASQQRRQEELPLQQPVSDDSDEDETVGGRGPQLYARSRARRPPAPEVPDDVLVRSTGM